MRSLPLITDIGLYVYYAMRTASGAVPYLGEFDVKTPLATLTGGLFFSIGDWVGTDPIVAVRVGFVAISCLAALLLGAILDRLDGRRGPAFALGVLAVSAFPLLGLLPAIGNIPKLLLAAAASAAALAVDSRRWAAAGALGALGFLDWQIGILIVFAVAAAAATAEKDGRWRRLLAVAGGAISVVALAALPFLLLGGFDEAVGQTIGAAFGRGHAEAGVGSLMSRLGRIAAVARDGSGAQLWVHLPALAGIPVFLAWVIRSWKTRSRPLLVALGVHHLALVGYSTFDFQRFGDLFILQHSLAFFLGVGLLAVLRLARRRTSPRWLPAAIVMVVAIAVTRPAILRPVVSLDSGSAAPGATLMDQREVVDRMRPALQDRRLAVVGQPEILILLRQANALPFAFWESGVHWYYGRSGESPRDIWNRLTSDLDADVIVTGRYRLPVAEGYSRVRISSENGLYGVTWFIVEERRPDRDGLVAVGSGPAVPEEIADATDERADKAPPGQRD